MKSVPTLRLSHLDAAQRRAYVIADNKLALNAGWHRELLAIELQGLIDLEFDVEVTGFSLAEIDFVLDEAQESAPDPDQPAENSTPPLADAMSAVTRCGDLWLLVDRLAPGLGYDSHPSASDRGRNAPAHTFFDLFELTMRGHVTFTRMAPRHTPRGFVP